MRRDTLIKHLVSRSKPKFETNFSYNVPSSLATVADHVDRLLSQPDPEVLASSLRFGILSCMPRAGTAQLCDCDTCAWFESPSPGDEIGDLEGGEDLRRLGSVSPNNNAVGCRPRSTFLFPPPRSLYSVY